MNDEELETCAENEGSAVEVFDAAEDTAEAAPAVEATEVSEERVAELSRKADENWERYVRAQAELENLRRRSERDLQNAHKYALERFAKDLLAVVDSLELGLQAASGETGGADSLREGMELTLKQLLSVLDRAGVRPVEALGERFNPDQHQAMAMEPTAEAAPNTVIRVFQKGYLLHDRLLRPALVVIAQAPPAGTGPSEA